MSHGANAKRRLSGRPLFWVGVIMIAALVVGYLARPEGQRAGNTLRSSFRTTPDGVAALARAIERLGRHTEARTTPLVDADPVRGTVMLLDAPLHPSPREVRGLLDRVRDGGTLLYAPPYTPGPLGLVPTQLMDSLGIRFRFRAVQDEILDRSLQEPRWSDHMLTAGLPEPMEPVIGMRGFRRGGDEELEEEPPADLPAVVPLLTAADHDGDEWMAAAELRLGEGRVVVFSDAGPLSNADALEDPLAVLAVRAALAYTDPADTVFFDEFHQGIGGQRSSAEVLADFFLGSPGGRAPLPPRPARLPGPRLHGAPPRGPDAGRGPARPGAPLAAGTRLGARRPLP